MPSHLNFNHVWIKSDCSSLVNLFNNDNIHAEDHLAPFFFLCKSCLASFEFFKISHVLREGNQCADALAGKALLEGGDSMFSHIVPSFMSQVFLGDLFGLIALLLVFSFLGLFPCCLFVVVSCPFILNSHFALCYCFI